MELANNPIVQHLTVIAFALMGAAWISLIAWLKGYYKLPHEEGRIGTVLWWQVLEAFAIFFIVEIFIAPAFLSFFFDAAQEGEGLGTSMQGWANLWAIGLTGVALFIFYLSLPTSTRNTIWNVKSDNISFKNKAWAFVAGGLSWGIVYPWVLALSQSISLVVEEIFEGSHIDQVAVKHLKDTLENPGLFVATAVAIVIVIPFVEELLFRGFLQSWLKQFAGRWRAIGITSAIFAMFHFSATQGVENVELVASLFLLSCFLGFVKEKFQSLWASIGLHSTFNLISIIMILVTSYAIPE